MMARKKGTWGGRREGAGRPAVLKDPVDRGIRLEQEDAKAAENLAVERGISFSEFMRRVLRSYLKRQKRR